MPAIGEKLSVPSSGDFAEILETSASTGGARVRTRAIFPKSAVRAPPHVHLRQEETFEVLSGRLGYILNGKKGTAGPGETLILPVRVPHVHFNEGPEDVVVIQTVTPGLDFDYFLETAYGLAAEGTSSRKLGFLLQGVVWLTGMESKIVLSSKPLWLQQTGALLLTPIARLLGFRPVYQRFSGEDW